MNGYIAKPIEQLMDVVFPPPSWNSGCMMACRSRSAKCSPVARSLSRATSKNSSPPPAHEHVRVAANASQNFQNLNQRAVASQVAAFVIHTLQSVDVQHQEQQIAALSAGIRVVAGIPTQN